MMANAGKRKMGPWSFKQQRELTKLAAASQSLETIANRMKRPTATILKKAAQLGISIKRAKDETAIHAIGISGRRHPL
jgi:hypothetical protein